VARLQGPLQRALHEPARRRGAQLQPVHRDHPAHQRQRDRGLQSRLRQSRGARRRARLDLAKLEKTVSTAMRMLDNVIDYNYYTVPQARRSNLRHRPVGLGIMGSRTRCTGCTCPTPRPRRSSSPTVPWRPSATTPSRPRRTWPPSAAAMPASTARCGAAAFCPRLDEAARGAARRLPAGRRQHHAGLDWVRERVRSVGMRNSNTMAIARPPRSRTSAASASRSSRLTRTSSSSRTCRASSPSSIPTSSATSRLAGCGTR